MNHAANPIASRNPVFDRQAALARMGGDERLFCDMVGFFLEDVDGLLARAETGIRTKDGDEIERAAHTIKGLSSNFDATRTQSAALRLERLGHAGDFEAADKALPELRQAVMELRDSLLPFREPK